MGNKANLSAIQRIAEPPLAWLEAFCRSVRQWADERDPDRIAGDFLQKFTTRAELVSLGLAASSELRSFRRAAASLTGGNELTGCQSVAFVRLTDDDITLDGRLSNNFIITLGADRLLDNPAFLRDGAYYNLWVLQDGTGGWELTFGSVFVFPDTTVPVLSTAPDALDILTFQYNAELNLAALVAINNFGA